MAEPATPTPSPEGSGPQPDDKNTPEGNPQPAPTPEPKPDDKKSFTQDDLNRLLAKEKREWEKKVADAEAKAKLSDDERLKAELADTKTRLAERDKRDTAVELAAKSGVKNTKLFYSAYASELTVDANGNITNFADVLATAKADSPELFITAAHGSADGGAGKETPATLTKDQVEKMSPDELNKRWDEVSKFLASQK